MKHYVDGLLVNCCYQGVSAHPTSDGDIAIYDHLKARLLNNDTPCVGFAATWRRIRHRHLGRTGRRNVAEGYVNRQRAGVHHDGGAVVSIPLRNRSRYKTTA